MCQSSQNHGSFPTKTENSLKLRYIVDYHEQNDADKLTKRGTTHDNRVEKVEQVAINWIVVPLLGWRFYLTIHCQGAAGKKAILQRDKRERDLVGKEAGRTLKNTSVC